MSHFPFSIKFFALHQQLLLLSILVLQCMSYVNGRQRSRESRIQCERPPQLPNGYSWLKIRSTSILQHYCNPNFKLIGDRRTRCVHGRWIGDRPVCAKSGCNKPLRNPENGRIQYVSELQVSLYCSVGYELAGNSFAYCNGTDWDRPLGICRVRSGSVSNECDFETTDLCGWAAEHSEGFKWKQVMAANIFKSFQTGPRHDHTTMKENGGHYMLMESLGPTSTPVVLTSPIYGREISLKTACCFQFHYFMYGAGVGNLNVYVKPVSKMLKDVIAQNGKYMKFTQSGNQNANWNEAHFRIEEMEDDFQIVFVADGAKNHLSDIAIDDVKIMTGTECKSLEGHSEEPDDSAEFDITTVENAPIYDTQSCVNRCMKESSFGIIRESDNTFTELCSCDDNCIEMDACCPDYVKVCLDAPNDEALSTTNILLTTTSTTTTPTTLPTTSTTTTMKPTAAITSTKTTTKTTTTPKPTTTNKTTTTVKTTVPVSTSSTTTTTTTRKPATPVVNTTTTTTTRRSTVATTPTTVSTSTMTTKRAQPTTKMTRATTTTITKSSSTSTTVMTPAKIPFNTQPIFEPTTGPPAIEHKTVTTDNMALPRKSKNHSQINTTKSTWEWHPKPENDSRQSLAIAIVFGLMITVIIVSAIYRQRATFKNIYLSKILKKGQNDDGAQDSNSIIANFRQEDPAEKGGSPASDSAGGNRIKLTLPSIRNKRVKRNSAEEDDFYGDNDNDDILLL
ncbi:uncharacterized protein [Eurosta solidaginis]|uniref:uncharacterized protein n=1 Tax=Eurosta solidaginis TaxID=178769 RepID=UPI0035313980